MNKTQPQKTLLNLSILAILYGVLPSNAMAADKSATVTKTKQTAEKKLDKKQTNKEGIEVITVSGTRASLKRALNAKRFSDQVMDGISAEDIGKLPDNNIAEALSRIAGVSMSRTNGEGEFVSIRGMDPALNNVTMNGQTMSSSGNGNVSPGSLGGNRGFDMNIIPAEMISAVEVYKSPSASMLEGSLGGTVNLKTRKAIEVGDQLSVGVKGTYDDKAEEAGFGLNGFFGLVDESETFGVTGTVSYYDRTTQRDSFETRGWLKRTDAPFNTTPGYNSGDENGDGAGVWSIEDIRSNFRKDDRERFSINANFQWLPTDNLDINLATMYSNQERDFVSTNWDVDFEKRDVLIVDPSSVVIDSNNVIRQIASAAQKPNFENSGFKRLYADETSFVNLTVDYLGENWTITPSIGTSSSESSIDWMFPIFKGKVQNIGYELENGSYSPNMIFDGDSLDNIPGMQPENMTLDGLIYRHMNVEETKVFAQLDFEYELDNETFSSFELGLRYSTTERDRDYENTNIKNAIKAANGGTMPAFTDYAIHYENSSMLSEAPVDNWYMPDFDKLDADFGGLLTDPAEQAWNVWSLEEVITSAYIQANIDTEWFGMGVRGNLGVRAIDTELDNQSSVVVGGQIDPISSNSNYSDVLPSLNLNFMVSEDLIVRTAVADVMARPAYDDLSPTIRRAGNSSSTTYISGNPDLDPYRATQYDLSVEWYFNSDGLLSFGFFYKDIESFITKVTDKVTLPDYNNGEEISLRHPINGYGATVAGLEFTYQQAFENGLGYQINYTFNDSDTELVNPDTQEFMPLPGLSEDTLNLIAYYDKDGINARIAYNYRSSYFDIFSFSGEAHFIDDYGQVDLGLGYDINKQISVNFDVTNLTDEKSNEFVGNSSRAFAVRDNGRRYSVNFKYKF